MQVMRIDKDTSEYVELDTHKYKPTQTHINSEDEFQPECEEASGGALPSHGVMSAMPDWVLNGAIGLWVSEIGGLDIKANGRNLAGDDDVEDSKVLRLKNYFCGGAGDFVSARADDKNLLPTWNKYAPCTVHSVQCYSSNTQNILIKLINLIKVFFCSGKFHL
eukprot:GHVR01058255.1.p3 GENE.GHVR01058255.1~~GHVR01058255.1.p3  ORF type:complete len:163 (-),score=35.94 GHVR01058255.1:1197-1685(-)